jgi:DNA-binding NarL/FixJ family response regulator
MSIETVSLRIATVEDDPRYRASLATLLRCLPRFELIAGYGAAEPLLDEARRAHAQDHEPPWDVVLTDVNLPGMDGIELTRALKRLFPALRIIALTVFEEPAAVLAAICAGADGYLVKSAGSGDIAAQLDALTREGAPLNASVARTLLNLVRVSQRPQFGTPLPEDLGLTQRQLEVLRALVDGQSYRDIGTRLGISIDTVRSHIRQIYAALQVHNVAEAVTFALRHGLA